MSDTAIRAAVVATGEEWSRANAKHAPMHSPHEGYAVLWEEVAELFETVRDAKPAGAVIEATQVAAMCVRYAIDVTDADPVRDVLAAIGREALNLRPVLSLEDGYGRLIVRCAALFAHVRADTGRDPGARAAAVEMGAVAVRIAADVPDWEIPT